MKPATFVVLLGVLGVCLGSDGTQTSKPEGEGDNSSNESVQLMYRGYPLRLSCNMSSHEDVSFLLDWFKDNVKLQESERLKIFPVNSSLVIADPLVEDVGLYRCEIANDSISEKPHPKTIQVIFFEVKRMAKSEVVSDQDRMTLDCPVIGTPDPTVVWKKDGKLIPERANDSTRVVYEKNSNNVPGARLVVNKVEMGDRGNYTCHITTLNNQYVLWSYVRVKGIYAALWPFLGIVVEVILLGIIIFIFEKRQAKAEFEESDTDQGNDQKNTADQNKDAVRQRK